MNKSTQAVVLGAGPGGYVAAIRLAQRGVKTILVEKSRVGGVCLNRGCIPSKAFIHAAKVVEHMQHAETMGILADKPRIDLARTKAWKDSIVQRLTGGIGVLLEKAGVEVVTGRGRFEDPHTLNVQGEDGATTIRFEQAIIATGSRSLEIPPFPYDRKRIISSTEALDLDDVPKRLCVIGGGVIGLEIGMYLHRFGAEVTVVEMMDQILPGIDADIVKTLSRALKKRKIKVHLNARAEGFEDDGDGIRVKVTTDKGKTLDIPCDKVLVSVGRRPNTEDLGLDLAGVQVGERGFIPVDAQLRTSTPHIFAIGDITGGALLAHKASKEGLVAAAVIAGDDEVYDVRAMPAAVFTEPEIATVGLTEDEAVSKGHSVRVGRFPFSALGKALTCGETEGFVKIVADAEDDRILGVHIIGHAASDLISEAAVAIEAGLCAEDLALTVHPHPTMGESLMEAAEAVHGMAIHILNP